MSIKRLFKGLSAIPNYVHPRAAVVRSLFISYSFPVARYS